MKELKKKYGNRSKINEGDLLETLWGLIANVSNGDWAKQPKEWQEATVKARDIYHKWIDEGKNE